LARHAAGMIKEQPQTPDLLAPLVAEIEARLTPKIMAQVRAELAAGRAESHPERLMLSLADAGARYGAGRIALKRMIADGRLPAVERVCRGGRVGMFLHIGDCERLLAGRAPRPGDAAPAAPVASPRPPRRAGRQAQPVGVAS
jgi:hypothetical protein